MLVYTCDTCGTSYDATVEGIDIVYLVGNKRERVTNPQDPCKPCDDEAEKAKQLALDNRRKLREELQK